MQIPADPWESRQVHVDAQRAEDRQAADDQYPAPAGRDPPGWSKPSPGRGRGLRLHPTRRRPRGRPADLSGSPAAVGFHARATLTPRPTGLGRRRLPGRRTGQGGSSRRLLVASDFGSGDALDQRKGGGDNGEGSHQADRDDDEVFGPGRSERFAELGPEEQPGGQKPIPIDITEITRSGTAASRATTWRSTPMGTPGQTKQAEGALPVVDSRSHADRQAAAGDDQADEDHHVRHLLQLGDRAGIGRVDLGEGGRRGRWPGRPPRGRCGPVLDRHPRSVGADHDGLDRESAAAVGAETAAAGQTRVARLGLAGDRFRCRDLPAAPRPPRPAGQRPRHGVWASWSHATRKSTAVPGRAPLTAGME